MNRNDFLRRAVRYLLFGLLAFMAAITGSRAVVKGVECSSCPGKGICAGETDCSTFLSDKDGRG